MSVASQAPNNAAPAASEMRAALAKMHAAQRKSLVPTYEERIVKLDKLERAVRFRRAEMVAAISRDFGNRSPHETTLGEVFLLLGAIKYTRAHLRDWMETDEREVTWIFVPARAEVLRQPLGVVGIISPWNYPVLLALSPLI
ncbi:MAG: aldehyde dehydrogenase family protein, partial [Myxococcota bacterium]|nr:aldehyde dehydrogenase family protein [Myxococcota bacterium]